jgi:hypothetical protein
MPKVRGRVGARVSRPCVRGELSLTTRLRDALECPEVTVEEDGDAVLRAAAVHGLRERDGWAEKSRERGGGLRRAVAEGT